MYSFPIFFAGSEVENIYPEDIRSAEKNKSEPDVKLWCNSTQTRGYIIGNVASRYKPYPVYTINWDTPYHGAMEFVGYMDAPVYRAMIDMLL